MWIVKLALNRPYTFIIMALLILLLSPVMIERTPVDMFPRINVPVMSLAWQYTGLNPEELEGRITTPFEKWVTTFVDDVDHVESTTYNGIAIVRVYMRPGADLGLANAQISSAANWVLRTLPPNIQPPEIITYSASSVPIVQLGVSGENLSEQALNDFAVNTIRPQLVTVPGALIPLPFGGKVRQVTVNLDQAAMQSRHVARIDMLNTLAQQNVVTPTGTVKIGPKEYDVLSNAAPRSIAELNDLPIRQNGGTTVFVHDVATISDGFQFQTNMVRHNGSRSVLFTIYKNGKASTLDVVGGIRAILPRIATMLPPQLKMTPIADQSVFVRAAVNGVVREAIIAAVLTGLMILLFLGNWRSTVIIAISIPLSILTSVICLSFAGETINTMTLGGLALAVGILVDDATVTIENIERFLEHGYHLRRAIVKGAAQIAVPAFVSTICICIVFLPMFFLKGVTRFLFVPLAESVIFAMLASYVLSRTLVPTLAMFLLRSKWHEGRGAKGEHEFEGCHELDDEQYEEALAGRQHQLHTWHRHAIGAENIFSRFHLAFERGFKAVRDAYESLLTGFVNRRNIFIPAFLVCCLAVAALVPWLGQDFFPSVDSGQFILHMRAPTGTRIEETARLADEVEAYIRTVVPRNEMGDILDNIGMPYSVHSTQYMRNGTLGPADVDIMVNLKEKHGPTADYVRVLRRTLPKMFPQAATFYFLPADLTTNILNFGLPAPIDVRFEADDIESSTRLARDIVPQLRRVPGLVDVRIQQPNDNPTLQVDVERIKASQGGFTERDVTTSMLNSLSGSFQTTPMFFLNWKNHVDYNMVAQNPQYKMDSLADVQNITVSHTGTAGWTGVDGGGNEGSEAAKPSEILSDLATIKRGEEKAILSHFNTRRVMDVYAAVQDRDLGATAADVNRVVKGMQSKLPRGTFLTVRGQAETMRDSYAALLAGLAFSVVLIYMLIVVNFQSWLDPFVIITALPAALAGIVLFLFFTHTRLSVPALMGAIMCMGVATANSILVVAFAKTRLQEHGNAIRAAIEAGTTRFRPVIMTALAMIIGMVPMSLGLGDGGEQNAPLGRAVIGGLLLATGATLIFVPAVFALVHGRKHGTAESTLEKPDTQLA